MDDLDRIGTAYLGHLTDADLQALVHADEISAAEADARIRALRRAPALLLDVLDRPAVSSGLLNLASARDPQRYTLVSPFLVFAAAIHRIATDLSGTGYVPERTTPRLRVPVFDGPQLTVYWLNRCTGCSWPSCWPRSRGLPAASSSPRPQPGRAAGAGTTST